MCKHDYIVLSRVRPVEGVIKTAISPVPPFFFYTRNKEGTGKQAVTRKFCPFPQ